MAGALPDPPRGLDRRDVAPVEGGDGVATVMPGSRISQFEVVDPTTGRHVALGEEGEIVVATLFWRLVPVMRGPAESSGAR